MVIGAIASQTHKDQSDYSRRVASKGGALSRSAQQGINSFIKRTYTLGLRDSSNTSHIVRHCSIYPTNTKAGVNENLWYYGAIASQDINFENNFTYDVSNGCRSVGSENGTFSNIWTSVTVNQWVNSNDCSIGYYVTIPSENNGEIGAVDGGYPNDRRFLVHPQYTGTRGCYFDVGNDINTRRVFGTISGTAGDKDNSGCFVCSKKGAIAYIRRHNYLIKKNSATGINFPLPANDFRLNGGYDNKNVLNVGGYWIGLDIPESLAQPFIEAWNDLQSSISPNRAHDYNLPSPKVWLDASSNSYLRTPAGAAPSNGQFIYQWLDRSGNGKHVTTESTNQTLKFENSGIQFQRISGSSSMSREDGFYFGAFAIVFTPKENYSYTSENVACIIGFNPGVGDGWEGAFLGGNKTGWFWNEVFIVIAGGSVGDGRMGFASNRVTLSANTRYCFALSRLGNREGITFLNSIEQVTKYDNQEHNTKGYSNVGFTLGSNNAAASASGVGGEKYNGLIHEVRSYSESLNYGDLQRISDELIKKWSIDKSV